MKDQRKVRFIVVGILFLILVGSILTSGCTSGDNTVTQDAPVAVPANEPEAVTVTVTPVTEATSESLETPAPERVREPDITATATITPTATLTPAPAGTPAP